jgi:hypothetical protein
MTTGALERMVRRGSTYAREDRCGLCAAAVPPNHRHVLDDNRDELLCACQACALLFERPAAGQDRYWLVPDRRLRQAANPGKQLGVPVGLAFFTVERTGTVVAHYPSPMGATVWEVDGEAWRGAIEQCPPLGDLQPAVEALLLNSVREADESWIVPVDDCYRLVAIVRQEWTGLSGGDRVWTEIERFFDQLSETRRRSHG